MKLWYHHKKILLTIGVLIILSLLFYFASPIFAAPTPSTKGTAILGALSGIGGTMATLVVIGQAVRMLGGVLLTIAAHTLDFAFQWNTVNIFTNAVSGEPLSTFWGYARDLVNGLLILILLWIAFGIIFSLERFNARRLLVRVILVGLLINFSLTLTSSVFAFANALAQPFAEQLKKSGGVEPGKTDPVTGGPVYRGMSVKIVEITNIHTVMNAASRDVQILKDIAERQQTAVPGASQQEQPGNNPEGEGPPTQTFSSNPVPQQVSQGGALSGVSEAEAVLPALLVPAAYGALKLIGVSIAATSITSFLEQFVLGQNSMGAIGAVSAGAWTRFLNPFVGALFLLVATFVVGSLAIVFMARGIIIMLLAILSPLAFAALIIPGQDKYFKMWMGKLINWSFFAPISFFLLLFAMRVGDKIQEASAASAKSAELQANLPAAFQFALILGLLISALAIAKYMGIQLAASLMSFGEKYSKKGLGLAGRFALGTARKAVLSPLAQASGKLEEALGRAPVGVQRFFGLPAAGLRRVTAIGRKEVGEARKQFSQMKDVELQRAITQGTFLTQADRTAAVLELAARKKLAPLPGAEGYDREGPKAMRDAVDRLLRMGGDYMEILKANPTISRLEDLKLPANDQIKLFNKLRELPDFQGFSDDNIRASNELKNVAAQLKIIGDKIDLGDLSKVDTGIYKDSKITTLPNGVQLEQGNISKELFILTKTPEFYRKIMSEDPDTGKSINDYFRTARGRELAEQMEASTFYFFGTQQAKAQGWNLPSGLESVNALRQDIQNLETRIGRLDARATILARSTDPAATNRHRKIMQNLAELRAEQTETTARLRQLQQRQQQTPPPPAPGAPTP